MFLLPYLHILALAELGATRVLNITELGPLIKPIPASLHLDPIPNPFPVPNADVTLDFIAQPGALTPLPKIGVIDCFILAKEHFETLIHDRPDGVIDEGYELTYGRVTLEIYSAFRFTYGAALSVFLGTSLKMAREGYESRWMRVLQTGGGDFWGTAVVR